MKKLFLSFVLVSFGALSAAKPLWPKYKDPDKGVLVSVELIGIPNIQKLPIIIPFALVNDSNARWGDLYDIIENTLGKKGINAHSFTLLHDFTKIEDLGQIISDVDRKNFKRKLILRIVFSNESQEETVVRTEEEHASSDAPQVGSAGLLTGQVATATAVLGIAAAVLFKFFNQ